MTNVLCRALANLLITNVFPASGMRFQSAMLAKCVLRTRVLTRPRPLVFLVLRSKFGTTASVKLVATVPLPTRLPSSASVVQLRTSGLGVLVTPPAEPVNSLIQARRPVRTALPTSSAPMVSVARAHLVPPPTTSTPRASAVVSARLAFKPVVVRHAAVANRPMETTACARLVCYSDIC